ncbi:hypothetical protein [Hyalangium minutum]|uniref:Uncharacterized protein n=1 Tax=Hyalangium minutum TaxID=394096 RepID=A0A085WHV6_9BACT|nr:hypothetical protein [Hyalangium minutum]KFE67269.1 hypothetical protein DB31_8622 [Hyalangium minutum]
MHKCKGFTLTEFAAYIAPTTGYRRPPLNFIWEAGYMSNLEVHDLAVGGTLFLVNDEEPRRMLGIKPRLRRWLNPWLSVDVAPGLLLFGLKHGSGFVPSYPAFSGHVALNFGDFAALSAQLEVLPLTQRSNVNPEGREVNAFIGLRLGSYPGMAVGSAAALLAWWADGFGD